ncbi:MAG: MFS transporter, PAT family, beta-lactamase induction signal transducer AmpG [Pelagibacterales bacterium]|jgi:PAT family beta-lactamase induction signal transducer AmpG|nr:MFS transporter, PAT family, beta-lactamase induction signal transducer AmpG [Pelagibacterales bacterium]
MSGFPWVMIGSALSLWLKDSDLSRSTIGWAGLIFGVYAINFLWSPLVDRIHIPYLSKKIGHRKSWIIAMQTLILFSLILWSTLNPSENLWLVIAVGLGIAISSATQDITIDALRIEQIGEKEEGAMAAGAAISVVGWWTGYKIGGVISLVSANFFQVKGFENYWQLSFLLLGLIVVLTSVTLIFVPEKSATQRKLLQSKNDSQITNKIIIKNKFSHIIALLYGAIVNPLLSFFKKNSFSVAVGILSFIFLFKIGEAFLGRMSIIFYNEIGFSKNDIALYSKGIGWITTITFTLLGGLFAIRMGLLKAMFASGILMALTNLMFSVLAWVGPSEVLFAFTVLIDDLAAAFATVAFVGFISALVDRTYTATQYALLASIGTAGRTLFASSSGTLVDWLNGDWGVFFIITAIMVIPSLLCLYAIKNKLKLNE